MSDRSSTTNGTLDVIVLRGGVLTHFEADTSLL